MWNLLFNNVKNSFRVDPSRIEAVGAERAAAEWLLRCGASVRWRGHETPLTDYNSLPAGGFRELNIEEIDATGSCIMSVGFPHLSNSQIFADWANCFVLRPVATRISKNNHWIGSSWLDWKLLETHHLYSKLLNDEELWVFIFENIDSGILMGYGLLSHQSACLKTLSDFVDYSVLRICAY